MTLIVQLALKQDFDYFLAFKFLINFHFFNLIIIIDYHVIKIRY